VASVKKRTQAEAGLPAELRLTYNALVDEYETVAKTYTSHTWVNYDILADLVRAGWRKDPS
jgi:hypothetical protein